MTTPLQVVRDHYAASALGDLDGMTAGFDPHVCWTEMTGSPYAGTYMGTAAVTEGVFVPIATHWSGYQAVPELFLNDGEHVVVFGRYAGSYRITGKPVDARFTHHWQVRDGVITRFEQYADTHLIRQAMA